MRDVVQSNTVSHWLGANLESALDDIVYCQHNLQSLGSCHLPFQCEHCMITYQEVLMNLESITCVSILKLLPHLPGATELIIVSWYHEPFMRYFVLDYHNLYTLYLSFALLTLIATVNVIEIQQVCYSSILHRISTHRKGLTLLKTLHVCIWWFPISPCSLEAQHTCYG